MIIENKIISRVYQDINGEWVEGIGCHKEETFIIRNCIVDLSSQDVDETDEAFSISWGGSAIVENCVFRGAAKLVLIGSGDRTIQEYNKTASFKNCIFEDFSRRAPEVQDGMKVYLEDCLIQNWGQSKDRFLVRSFASWAHGEGSYIHAKNCIYNQERFFGGHFWRDFIGHFGQAINDSGFFKGIFSKAAWQPGVCKGLVATDTGEVEAENCYKNHWWINIENCDGKMSKDDAEALEAQLWEMQRKLYSTAKPSATVVVY